MEKQYFRLIEYIDKEIRAMSVNHADFSALYLPHEIARLIKEFGTLAPGALVRQQAIQIARRIVAVQNPPPSEVKLLRSIDTAIRLWLTVALSSLDFQQPGIIVWTDEASLQETVRSHFEDLKNSQTKSSITSKDNIISPHLTAHSLVNNYGFTIFWTHNLAEHLTIDWKDKVITIYEHNIYLYNHLRFARTCILPQELVEEALDTLNLLFPLDDATKRFLLKHKKPFHGLGLCNRPRKLELEDYQYWRGRIADLVFITQGPPAGLQQLRLDEHGGNLLQFATFWIASAVGVLTVVGLGAAVIATVYSVLQYKLAQKQYDLSVAQACLDSNFQAQLPQYCS